jgi:hypothetical protein
MAGARAPSRQDFHIELISFTCKTAQKQPSSQPVDNYTPETLPEAWSFNLRTNVQPQGEPLDLLQPCY